MSATTRVNGDGFYTAGTLFSVYQQKAVVLVAKDNSSAAVDLRAVDGPGVDELVSLIVREFQPLMYQVANDNSGTIYMIIDGHPIDSATLQLRLRHVVAGKLGLDESANTSTAAVGTSITVA